MKWTNEPPKEPGWYWFRSVPYQKTSSCVMVERRTFGRMIGNFAWGWSNISYLTGTPQWAGPIPEPEEAS